jgi:hypothetical protein
LSATKIGHFCKDIQKSQIKKYRIKKGNKDYYLCCLS